MGQDGARGGSGMGVRMAFDRRRLDPNDARLIEARERRANGETYDVIAAEFGVKPSTVHRWLNGESPQRRQQVREAVARTVKARRERGVCIDCGAPPAPGTKLYCERCGEANRARKRAQHRRLRAAAIAAYGAKCVCCGETEDVFLTIDHANNDGAEHRRELGTNSVLRWLAKHGYPEGFQVLCFNCNLGRAKNGGVCPHEEKRGEVRQLRAV